MIAYLPAEGKELTKEQIPARAVVALGVFDGVHRGHRALLARARALADRLAQPLLVLTFCSAGKAGGLLTTPALRTRLFARAQVDVAVFYEFSEISHLSPATFVQEVLLGKYGCCGAVCGTDFRFGAGRAGDAAMLAKLLAPYPVELVPPVCSADGVQISSTLIRGLLAEGDVAGAAELLGAPYTLYGKVRHGRGFGHKLGSPTANIALPSGIQMPRYGVYVTRATIGGVHYPAVTNIGRNPTVVAEGEVTCETYLLSGGQDLYGQEIAVSFLAAVRAEQKFADVAALRAQIAADAETARAWFAHHPDQLK